MAARSGLRPPEWVLRSRAADRARARGVAIDAYSALLADDGELDSLIESLRVGETRFFRHAGQVQALERVVVPSLARARGTTRRLRAWSAGCATGEEAYTLAMLLSEQLSGFTLSVLGTDISPEAIAHARAGVYPAASIDETRRRRWFRRKGASIHVAKLPVTFEQRNLLDAPPAGPWDIILCRNVLMYFDPETRHSVITRLTGALADDGFLLLGYAESARNTTLRAVEPGVYQRPTPDAPRPTPDAPRPTPTRTPTPTPTPTRTRTRTPTIPTSSVAEPIGLTGTPTAADVSALLRDALERHASAIDIDLDGAEYLDDAVATVLRRASAAARAAGVPFRLHARRPGTRRWLSRNGLT